MAWLMIAMLYVLLPTTAFASPPTVTQNPGLNALRDALQGFGGTVLNLTVTKGIANQTGTFVGGLTGPGPNVGFEDGLVMSTGLASKATGAASNFISDRVTNCTTPKDNDLATIEAGTQCDLLVIDFDFIPAYNNISTQFVFGSEEYKDWQCTQYNDAFGFFVSGPGITGTKNIALVPGTTTPVTINTINDGTLGSGQNVTYDRAKCPNPNTSVYRDNRNGPDLPTTGLTTVLVQRIIVQRNQTYHMKLVISDIADQIWDSFVYIDAFTSDPYDVYGNVFDDRNNNGLRDAGEPGIPNVTVSASDGTQTVNGLTDSNGDYGISAPPTGFTGPVTVSHARSAPTGSNLLGSSVVLANTFNDVNARQRTITGFTIGTLYKGYNFGIVPPSLLEPDRTGVAVSPGSVAYTHLYRPGTLGTVALTTSGNYTYRMFFDANCDGTIDTSERAAPVTSLTVNATWPRETTGQLKACVLEVLVLVPTGLPVNAVDAATVTATLTWQGSSVTDPSNVQDITRLGAQNGALQLNKQVRNFTTGSPFGMNVGGKPGEVLEYCIIYRNVGSNTVSSVVMRDPVPFFTTFVSGSIQVRQLDDTVISNITDAAGFNASSNAVIVNLGTVNAGDSRKVCYRARIR